MRERGWERECMGIVEEGKGWGREGTEGVMGKREKRE